MAATPAELFALFDRLEIEHSTVEHPPFFTVEEGRPYHDKIPGLHCKNLFIKDRKGGIWLVVLPADKQVDLGRLEKALGAPRFSFARPKEPLNRSFPLDWLWRRPTLRPPDGQFDLCVADSAAATFGFPADFGSRPVRRTDSSPRWFLRLA